MKLLRWIAIAAILSLLRVLPAMAAGSTTIAVSGPVDEVYSVTYTFTADASDGSVPNETFTSPDSCFFFLAITNPGSTAPTDDYDIVISDSNGADIFGTALNDRDTSVSEQTTPTIGSANGGRYVPPGETLTIAVSNNSVNSATLAMKLYCLRQR